MLWNLFLNEYDIKSILFLKEITFKRRSFIGKGIADFSPLMSSVFLVLILITKKSLMNFPIPSHHKLINLVI